MRKSHLILGLSILCVTGVTGCNRAETDAKARRAGTEVRDLAGRAGDQLADSWLATKIQAQFFADDDVKARDIRVSARDGVVTLSGTVDSMAQREEALSIARNTDGVERIEDQLKVGVIPGTPEAQQLAPAPVGTSGVDPSVNAYPTDDASLTTTIQAKLFRDGALKRRHIDVASQNGVVTLRGTVANDNERAQARLLAWTTGGVTRVDDALTIDRSLDPGVANPLATSPAPQAAPGSAPSASPTMPPNPSPVAQQPESSPAAGARDADLEAAVRAQMKGMTGITVSARDGVVLLDGAVPTTAAKQRALTAARGANGVVQVVDRIRVGER